MFFRMFRGVAILVVAACAVWGFAATSAEMSYPVSQFSGNAGDLATAAVVYSQPPNPAGGLLLSSLRDPDGSPTDKWVWDNFTLGWAQAITEVQWRGGYDPAGLGTGGPVFNFTVAIYASIPSGLQPDLSQPPLVRHEVGGNANETPAEVLGGVQTYDYHYVLPAPFQAAAGTKYWIQIEAFQRAAPDWGLVRGTLGDGQYFRRLAGPTYQIVVGDAAFALLGPLTVTPTVTATATPTATVTPTPTDVTSPHAVFLPIVLRSTSGAMR